MTSLYQSIVKKNTGEYQFGLQDVLYHLKTTEPSYSKKSPKAGETSFIWETENIAWDLPIELSDFLRSICHEADEGMKEFLRPYSSLQPNHPLHEIRLFLIEQGFPLNGLVAHLGTTLRWFQRL